MITTIIPVNLQNPQNLTTEDATCKYKVNLILTSIDDDLVYLTPFIGEYIDTNYVKVNDKGVNLEQLVNSFGQLELQINTSYFNKVTKVERNTTEIITITSKNVTNFELVPIDIYLSLYLNEDILALSSNIEC